VDGREGQLEVKKAKKQSSILLTHWSGISSSTKRVKSRKQREKQKRLRNDRTYVDFISGWPNAFSECARPTHVVIRDDRWETTRKGAVGGGKVIMSLPRDEDFSAESTRPVPKTPERNRDHKGKRPGAAGCSCSLEPALLPQRTQGSVWEATYASLLSFHISSKECGEEI